jgi:hypothetical protein
MDNRPGFSLRFEKCIYMFGEKNGGTMANHGRRQGGKKGEWGGARDGAGAPRKDPHLKKRQVGILLPGWLIEKIDTLAKSRAVEIEAALCQVHGWRRPVVVPTGKTDPPDK